MLKQGWVTASALTDPSVAKLISALSKSSLNVERVIASSATPVEFFRTTTQCRAAHTVGEGRLRREAAKAREKRTVTDSKTGRNARNVKRNSASAVTQPRNPLENDHEMLKKLRTSNAYMEAASGKSKKSHKELLAAMERDVLGAAASTLSNDSSVEHSDVDISSDMGSDFEDFSIDFSKLKDGRASKPSTRTPAASSTTSKITKVVDSVISSTGLDIADAFESEARRLSSRKQTGPSSSSLQEIEWNKPTTRGLRDVEHASDSDDIVDVVKGTSPGSFSSDFESHNEFSESELQQPEVFDFPSDTETHSVNMKRTINKAGNQAQDVVHHVLGLRRGDPLGDLIRHQLKAIHSAALQPSTTALLSAKPAVAEMSLETLEEGRIAAARILPTFVDDVDAHTSDTKDSTATSLEDLDPLRGAELNPDDFPAAQALWKDSDLHKLPSYPVKKAAMTANTLRERSAVQSLQKATIAACKYLPSHVQEELLRGLSQLAPLPEGNPVVKPNKRLQKRQTNTPALSSTNSSNTSIALHQSTAITEAPDGVINSVGMIGDMAKVDSSTLKQRMDAVPDGFASSQDDSGLVISPDMSPAEIAAAKAALPLDNTRDVGDSVAALRKALGFDKPHGMRHPPPVEHSSRKAVNKLKEEQQVQHEAQLRRLRGDPTALAKYVMEQGELRDDKLEAALQDADADVNSAALYDDGDADGNGNADSSRKERGKSMVPEGFKDWTEVVNTYSSNAKRTKKTQEVINAQQLAVLRKPIKKAVEAGGVEPSRRQVRVAAQIHRVLESVFARRLVKDAALYPSDIPIEIVEVSVTPDLRRAYVRWMLPFPILPDINTATGAPHTQLHGDPTLGSTTRVSASTAALMEGILLRNGSRASNKPRSNKKQTVGQHTKEFYGDDSDVSHLPGGLQAAVKQVSDAITRNSASIKRAVGFELGMQYMPLLEFHRHVTAEKEAGMTDLHRHVTA